MPYLTVYTDDLLNTANIETAYTEPKIFFEEGVDIKIQEGSVLKYLNSRICQSPLGLIVDNTDHIMKLVN